MTQPIFAGGPGAAQDIFLQELPSSLSATLSATARQAWDTNPVSLIGQEIESYFANRNESSPMLAAEEARKRIKDARLKLTVPDTGIRESALDLLMESKYQEKLWQDTISRGPTGLGVGSLQFLTGLGTSMLDPLNIASAFIPFVGEARLGAMLERAGAGFASRGLVRAKVGAIEGFGGAAVLEPFVYAMAQDLQKDYTAADSLMNLAFGTVLGGGLHVGVGAVRDHYSRGGDIRTTPPVGENGQRISALSPEDRADTFKVALAQAIDGRQVDVEAFIRLRENIAAIAKAEGMPGFLRTADDLLALQRTERTPDVERGVTIENTPGFLRNADDLIFKRAVDSGELDVAARREKITEELKGKSPDEIGALVAAKAEDQRVREQLLADKKLLDAAAKERNVSPKELRERVEKQHEVAAQDLEIYKQLGFDTVARERAMSAASQLTALSARSASPNARIAPEDARAADESAAAVRAAETETKAQDTDPEKVIESEKAALTEETKELKALEDAVEQKEPSGFEAEDKLIADAETLAKASEALARCQLRH